MAELNSSLEEEGSSGVGLLEPNSPLKKDMLADQEIESSFRGGCGAVRCCGAFRYR